MQDYDTAPDTGLQAIPLAVHLRQRLVSFLTPLLDTLDAQMDARLVRTLQGTVEAILMFRHRAYGLLLSELGGFLLDPAHAPAGTKRLSNLLRSSRWAASLIEQFLWRQADARLKALEEAGEERLLLWDTSVQEKVESCKAEGLCSVRSSKAARCLRPKPGFWTPPTRRPVFVPGLHWLALLLMGPHGAPTLACMQWWTRRGHLATTDGQVHTRLLVEVVRRWGGRVLHVFDRAYCEAAWLGAMLGFDLRFVVRFRKDWHLRLRDTDASLSVRSQAAWKLARGKRSRDKRQVWDARRRCEREQGILWLSVEHPKYAGIPLWLVVSRPGKGRVPWYLLTNEPIENAEQAWRVVFAYARRWQIEQCFRYNKSELAMESPRLWTWERRIKLLLLVSLCYAFLLSLLDPLLEWLTQSVLRQGCHRTGKRSQETLAPLYRLRAALSRLWLDHPRLPALMSTGNSG